MVCIYHLPLSHPLSFPSHLLLSPPLFFLSPTLLSPAPSPPSSHLLTSPTATPSLPRSPVLPLPLQLVTLQEAKLLLNEDDYLLKSVYDYWVRKRKNCRGPALIPFIKQESRDGSTNNDPYVAFRRRTEKMQTRKVREGPARSDWARLRVMTLPISLAALKTD